MFSCKKYLSPASRVCIFFSSCMWNFSKAPKSARLDSFLSLLWLSILVESVYYIQVCLWVYFSRVEIFCFAHQYFSFSTHFGSLANFSFFLLGILVLTPGLCIFSFLCMCNGSKSPNGSRLSLLYNARGLYVGSSLIRYFNTQKDWLVPKLI